VSGRPHRGGSREEIGASVYAIRAIEKGSKANRKNTRKLREFLEAQATNSSDSTGSSHALVTKVITLAAQNGCLDGVYSYSFRQLMRTIEPGAAKAEASRILMNHLTSV
jgi:hypothetical protein